MQLDDILSRKTEEQEVFRLSLAFVSLCITAVSMVILSSSSKQASYEIWPCRRQMYSRKPLRIRSEIVIVSEFLYFVTGENLWHSENCIKF